jgi:cytochrome c oxidase assembly protein subunit 15
MALHWYCRLLVCATLFLVAAGGMVTSTASGLAVPDWPTTYGQSMFAFPLDRMVGGIFYEHGHRLIATTVGILTIGLAIWIWRADGRPVMTRLGLVALAAVIVQGLLGGLTVIYFLPWPISVSHAGLAQVFFCLVVSLALFTSRSWRQPGQPNIDDPRLRRRLRVLVAAIGVQIVLGATMRHTGAGLAIPDFPLAFGRLLPPDWSAPVALHFAHRVGAVIVTILVIMNAAYVWRRYGERRDVTGPVWLLVLALAVQVVLGATVVLSARQELVNTLHVAIGAVVLATGVVLTLRSHRAVLPALTS